MKIYIASPLFTPEEKKLINEVAAELHREGFETYLPMEHGVPDSWSYTNPVWGRKIFDLDVQAIDECDGLLCIYYGMDSDSGTSWEVGYSYAKQKYIVIYHAYDIHNNIGSAMICNGSTTNVNTIQDIPRAFNRHPINALPYQS